MAIVKCVCADTAAEVGAGEMRLQSATTEIQHTQRSPPPSNEPIDRRLNLQAETKLGSKNNIGEVMIMKFVTMFLLA
jgi:hypothetical protein